MMQLTMVQLPPPAEPSDCGLDALQLEVSIAYLGYDSYIEDGLICLKHKVRNLEKRKVGLQGGRGFRESWIC